jgi:UDP-GlcNAc:undecaprenyl-phosphate/decaprenyl-phosphate GlcNAc-1-phosphate transferase
VTGEIVAGLVAGGVGAGSLALIVLRKPAPRLMRSNVNEVLVPAVLGPPVVAAGAVVALVAGATEVGTPEAVAAVVIALLATGAAGLFDDLRGGETARGFRGHLRAARAGRVTGGIVKLVAGGLGGLGAAALVSDGAETLLSAALVAGTANLFNLLDTAPGRAGKVAVVLGAALLAVGDRAWAAAAAGTVGAAVGVLPLDLKENGMLGDAGANPVGAVAGLGLAMSLAPGPEAAALGIVVALNLASEKWSLGRVIEQTPGLRAFDLWGRRLRGPGRPAPK